MYFTKSALPTEVMQEGGVARISAGADTSALVTESGRVWTWGNSVSKPVTSEKMMCGPAERSMDAQEYAQALHGRKIDQILRPLAIDHSFVPPNRRLVDYRCGGSFALALDGAWSLLPFPVPASESTPPWVDCFRKKGGGEKMIDAGAIVSAQSVLAAWSGRDRQNPDGAFPFSGDAETSLYRRGIAELFFPPFQEGFEKLHTIRKPSPDLPQNRIFFPLNPPNIR